MVIAIALPIGFTLSLMAAPLFAELLYGVGRRDWASMGAAMAVAIVVSCAGIYAPCGDPFTRICWVC